MITELRPYPAMKKSGVAWLGAVPEHWDVAALRHRYSQALGKMLDAKRITGRHLLPYLRNTDVQWDRVRAANLPTMDIPPSETARYTVNAGDLLVCEGGEIGRCAIWAGPAGVVGFQKALHRLRPWNRDRENPRFIYYTLRAACAVSAFDDGHVSTIAHLTGDKLRAHRFAFPSGSEQAAIVRFLDYADRRIRRYIRAKQKMIKLLEEQKQAIIHRAVTRGLDPDVRLKPSGVEWLGEVPEGWDVVALKRILTRLVDCEHRTAPAIESGPYRVVRTTAVRSGRIRWEGTYSTTPQAFAEWTQRAVPEPGDVIFTREAPAGEACVVPDGAQVCLGQRTVLMKVHRASYVPEFLVWMIYAGPPRDRIRLATQGSTVGHFNMDDIGWMHVLKPPLKEQLFILGLIRRETAHLDGVGQRAESEIDLLREYRTRLIADVVTGKLDVREAAARLPDEGEEPELVDGTEAEADPEGIEADASDEVPEEAEA